VGTVVAMEATAESAVDTAESAAAMAEGMR